jgi:hypothetical protein
MSNPFNLTDLPNSTWAVSWPLLENGFSNQMKFNLLDMIFSEIDCNEAGLGVSLDEREELSVVWIKRDAWRQELTEEYSVYLQKFYRVQGAVFYEYDEAAKFKEILEKRYAWQLLKE